MLTYRSLYTEKIIIEPCSGGVDAIVRKMDTERENKSMLPLENHFSVCFQWLLS